MLKELLLSQVPSVTSPGTQADLLLPEDGNSSSFRNALRTILGFRWTTIIAYTTQIVFLRLFVPCGLLAT
jgi:hypothetical protein